MAVGRDGGLEETRGAAEGAGSRRLRACGTSVFHAGAG